jgi:hypothetical protein
MTKADLHRLLDRLPDAAIEGIARVLERAADDYMVAVLDAAPLDDEAYTDKERAEDAAALIEPGIPLDQVRRELLD